MQSGQTLVDYRVWSLALSFSRNLFPQGGSSIGTLFSCAVYYGRLTIVSSILKCTGWLNSNQYLPTQQLKQTVLSAQAKLEFNQTLATTLCLYGENVKYPFVISQLFVQTYVFQACGQSLFLIDIWGSKRNSIYYTTEFNINTKL